MVETEYLYTLNSQSTNKNDKIEQTQTISNVGNDATITCDDDLNNTDEQLAQELLTDLNNMGFDDNLDNEDLYAMGKKMTPKQIKDNLKWGINSFSGAEEVKKNIKKENLKIEVRLEVQIIIER